MAKIKLDIKNLPVYVKALIVILPSVLISLLVVIFLILPRQKEIKALDAKIDEQNNQIAVSQAKGARLDLLIKENERLLSRLKELGEQLPEEKEISSLLKQISDLSIASGLEMKSWKPGQKTTHSSGIVYEIPFTVAVSGTYHNLGNFLSSLTRLNRIVNINTIQIGAPQTVKGSFALPINITASTFSAVSETEGGKK